MNYDHWKTTDPAAEFLGPEPLPEDEQQLSEEALMEIKKGMAMNDIATAIDTLMEGAGLTEADAHRLGDYSRTLGLLCMERKWAK